MAHAIRLASYEDAPTLIELMRELAEFEKMEASFNPSLYPELTTSALENVSLDFADVGNGQRAAQFLVNGETRSIYYGWVLNYVVFAASKNCLIAAINDTYAPQGH